MAASDAVPIQEVQADAVPEDVAHGPSEDYAPPSDKTKRKAEAFRPIYSKAPTEDKFGMALAVEEGKDKLKQEALGLKQGVTDPYYGGKQLLKHVIGKGEEADKEVATREKEYQKATPEGSGVGRVAGNLITALMGGASSMPVAAAKAGLQAALTPVTNTEEDSFAYQKAKQVGLGAGLGIVPQLAQEGTRWALRGRGEAAAKGLEQNLATFRRAGVQPTLGQVSEGGLTKGAGASEATRATQTAALAAKSERELGKLSDVRSQSEAGQVIDEGLRGKGGYLERVKDTQTKMYADAETALPSGTSTKLTNTLAAFKEVTALRPGMKEVSATFVDPKIETRYVALIEDAGKGRALPYEDVKWLRSQIGEQVSNPLNQAPGTSIANLRKLYAGLSQDMEAAAATKGPKAQRLMKAANDYTRTEHEKLDAILQPLINKKIPEDIYQAALLNSQNGATRIKTVMESLEPVQQDAIRSAYLNNEVLAKGPADFFKNWSNIHPDVKEALFGKQGAAMRTTFDKMSQVAGVVAKRGGTLTDMRSFVMNHSGEGEIAALAYLTHYYSLANVLIGGAGVGFLAGRSKLVSNPKFMKWLASSATKAPATLIASLSQLQSLKDDMSDADQAEVDAYLADVRGLAQ